MTSLVLPATLTPGANENVNDLNSDLNAIVSWANGNVDEANVPNLAAAFTTYKTVLWGGSAQTGGGPGTFLLWAGPSSTSTSALSSVGGASTAALAFYLDPADFNANARTTRLRIRSVCVTNAVAPAITLTTGLYPVATWGGASGAQPTIASLGAVVLSAAHASPALSTQNVQTSTDTNAPAAGHYVMGVNLSGAMAAGAAVVLQIQLQMRQV